MVTFDIEYRRLVTLDDQSDRTPVTRDRRLREFAHFRLGKHRPTRIGGDTDQRARRRRGLNQTAGQLECVNKHRAAAIVQVEGPLGRQPEPAQDFGATANEQLVRNLDVRNQDIDGPRSGLAMSFNQRLHGFFDHVDRRLIWCDVPSELRRPEHQRVALAIGLGVGDLEKPVDVDLLRRRINTDVAQLTGA